MRFLKGFHYAHPPRGRARKRYCMSDEALAQRRRNLSRARAAGRLWRCYDESLAIRQLIRQWAFDPQPKLSQRALAHKLGVWPSYVRKVMDKALSEGADALAGQRGTWDDLAEARLFTARIRVQEPGLFAPIPTGCNSGFEGSTPPPVVSEEEKQAQRRAANLAAALDRLQERRDRERLAAERRALWAARSDG